MSLKKIAFILTFSLVIGGSLTACQFKAPDSPNFGSMAGGYVARGGVETGDGVNQTRPRTTVSIRQAVASETTSAATAASTSAAAATTAAKTTAAATSARPSAPAETQGTQPPAATAATSAAAATAAPVTAAPAAETTAAPAAQTEAPAPPQETGTQAQAQPVSVIPPESEPKDPSYFASSLFIGDSRTQGLMLYGELYDAYYIYGKGMNVGDYFTKDLGIDGGGTAAQIVLEHKGQYKDIYLGFGINECGWPLDGFIETYTGVIQHVKDLNPQANIYVQAILPVAASQNSDPYVNNTNIKRFNAAIEQMAVNLGIYYLDATPAVAGPDGCIPEDASPDGIHYDHAYVMKWQYFIQTHVAPPKG